MAKKKNLSAYFSEYDKNATYEVTTYTEETIFINTYAASLLIFFVTLPQLHFHKQTNFVHIVL